jgi:hypothetical protein
MARMNAVEAAVLVLEREGVAVAFGVPGAAINPLYAALLKRGSIRHILARHVEGASHMADGYSRAVRGNIGVCIGAAAPIHSPHGAPARRPSSEQVWKADPWHRGRDEVVGTNAAPAQLKRVAPVSQFAKVPSGLCGALSALSAAARSNALPARPSYTGPARQFPQGWLSMPSDQGLRPPDDAAQLRRPAQARQVTDDIVPLIGRDQA